MLEPSTGKVLIEGTSQSINRASKLPLNTFLPDASEEDPAQQQLSLHSKFQCDTRFPLSRGVGGSCRLPTGQRHCAGQPTTEVQVKALEARIPSYLLQALYSQEVRIRFSNLTAHTRGGRAGPPPSASSSIQPDTHSAGVTSGQVTLLLDG